ncbi:MAG: pantetheine-phosphate adenylyltransferase [Rhodospirillaceae bacterium]|jgi:pantetheine-phosphate adenylyltransferase|nr:pantetheine-phosphate adenylyltransferase [Rhodospirillaceae bacterium]MBT5374404.1 pantetheine-phosphate adenylyltransferase [Rhodospirillaceae bacterium]MBT5660378.1 pantetheine-phosphate adenylyltransferase [Rhodospirillaceae bacterium]MBT5751478.1 pantetheine-phosphate adenylyltransferase [Rhodospirillaceae bacterium]
MTSKKSHAGIYPGTFDPVTYGHLDIIQRATRIVDMLIVAVAANDGKNPSFDLDSRIEMLKDEVSKIDISGKTIKVLSFDTLLVDFAHKMKAGVIIRGLRAVSDFEYEFQMAGTNARLNRSIETVFLMASDRHQFTSSKLVKEIARLGGDISDFVPPHVARRIKKEIL